jgi:hypothetical protein
MFHRSPALQDSALKKLKLGSCRNSSPQDIHVDFHEVPLRHGMDYTSLVFTTGNELKSDMI